MAASNLGRTLGAAACGSWVGANQELVGDLMRTALPGSLNALLRPAAAATATAAAAAPDANALALAASVRAMEALLRQQQPGSRVSTKLLLLACPIAAGIALQRYGWGRLGWVTPERLREQLQAIREELVAKIAKLGHEMHQRFCRVDDSLADTSRNVQELRSEMQDGLRALNDSMGALDERIGPMESNVQEVKQGVGLLCEVVRGLDTNAPADLRRRLDDYTGSASTAGRPSLTASAPAALMPPPPPPYEKRSSSFLRTLLDTPGASHSASAPVRAQ